MLSSHRLCPCSWRISVAFTLLLAVSSAGPVAAYDSADGRALVGHLGHPVGGEAELGQQLLERCRGAEGVHPDDRPAVPHVAVPAEGRRLLDGHPRLHRGRQHRVAVLRGWRSNSSQHGMLTTRTPMPSAGSSLAGRHRQLDLRPGGQQDDVRGRPRRLRQHVGAPGHTRGRAPARSGRRWAGPGGTGRGPPARGGAATTCARFRPPRWRRPAGTPEGPAPPAARPAARLAGGSDRPRRPRSSRG